MAKTYLPQNKFYSAADVPSLADEAGASAPAPTPVAPADFSCEGVVRVGANGANSLHRPEASGVTPRSQEKAVIDSCQEPVAADLSNSGAPQPRGEPAQINATQPAGSPNISTDCIGLLFYHARRLALPRFAPDYEAIWNAMHDNNAPRMLAGDPVWADASPLFLKG